MGEVLKNKTSFTLTDDLSNFFSLPTLEEKPEDYSELKERIYELDTIDKEEKANIINLINSLATCKTDFQKSKVKKEIEEFQSKHNL